MITKRSIRVPIVPMRSPTLEWAALIVIVMLLVALMGCAGAPVLTHSVALRAVNSGLIAVDMSTDQRVEDYTLGRMSRLKECRDKDLGSTEEREACMGPYKESIADDAAEAAAAYDVAVMAVDALSEALTNIDRAIAAAEETYYLED